MSYNFTYIYWVVAALISAGSASNLMSPGKGLPEFFGMMTGGLIWFAILYLIIYACKKVYEML